MRYRKIKVGPVSSFGFGLFLSLALALSAPLAGVRAQQTTLVSVSREGRGSANAGSVLIFSPPAPQRRGSSSSVVTPDGRFVVFTSAATDLVASPHVSPGVGQIYVRDRLAGTTRLVSVNRAGTGGANGTCFDPAISGDGRYVVFNSFATDLVATDTNGLNDIFVRDLETGSTALVTANRAGRDSGRGAPRYPNGLPQKPLFFNERPLMSTDGRRVVFLSYADDLVENDTNNALDVFVRDLAAGRTSCVSVNRNGVPSGNYSRITNEAGLFDFDPEISADGRFVAFVSYANDLVENDTVCAGPCDGTNGIGDIFVRDLEENRTVLVSVNAAGTGGNSISSSPSLSADGSRVAFRSFATDLVTNDATTQSDIFVRDLRAGTTTLASVGPTGRNGVGVNASAPLVSGDGRFVTFSSAATDLAPNKTDILPIDVFVRDLARGKTTLASVNLKGNDSGRHQNVNSIPQAISYDGRFVVFNSNAPDLVEGDTNNAHDAFVRDIVRGITAPLNLSRDGSFSAAHASGDGRMSADGRVLIFESSAPDLTEGDANGAQDVFARLLFRGNPIDDTHFFVRRHYLDFLGRDPDAAGLEFWVDRIESCGPDPRCVDERRISVSAAFFLSIEFQNTGYLLHRLHAATFAGRLPRFAPFMADLRRLSEGVVVLAPGWEQRLEANKQAFIREWVERPEFAARFPPGMAAAEYVNALFTNAGVIPTEAERAAAVSAFGGGGEEGRAHALRSVAESDSVYNRQYNAAFVLMQYFGYLRRDPDDPPDGDLSGYEFWLAKLNSFTLPGENARDERVALSRVHRAEMVKAFLVSLEYRRRFDL